MNEKLRGRLRFAVLVLAGLSSPALAQQALGWTLDHFKDMLGRCTPYGEGQRCEAQAPPDGIFRGTFDARGHWMDMTTWFGHAMTADELDQFQGELLGCEVDDGNSFCVYLRPGQRVILLRKTDSYMVKITPSRAEPISEAPKRANNSFKPEPAAALP